MTSVPPVGTSCFPSSPCLWHSGGMTDETCSRKPALQFSFPPYFVALVDAGVPLPTLSGQGYKDLETHFAPSGAETRETLLALRAKLRWSRPMLAAFLGVSRDVVRRWETGERQPSGAARRLVWLMKTLLFDRATLHDGMDLVLWGKRDLCKAYAHVMEGSLVSD